MDNEAVNNIAVMFSYVLNQEDAYKSSWNAPTGQPECDLEIDMFCANMDQ